jgi:hypothetical protein
MKNSTFLALLLSSSSVLAQVDEQLIVCSQLIGSSKTSCEAPRLLKESSFVSNYSVFYDYACKYNFTANVPVLTPTLASGSVYHQFQIGLGQRMDVPEAQQLAFRYLNDKQPMFHKDCSLKLTKIVQTPAASTLSQWSAEARRLTQLLEAKAEHYRNVVDTDLLIDHYTIEKLKGMQFDLQSIFNQTVSLALAPADTQLPPSGPPGAGEKLPEAYDLEISTWEELDVFAPQLGMVTQPAGAFRYRITLEKNRNQHKWYFDAMETLPVVSHLLSQLVIVAEAKFMKEQARDHGYALPDQDKIKAELRVLVTEAQGFLNQIRDYREELKGPFEQLEGKINQTNTGLSQAR